MDACVTVMGLYEYAQLSDKYIHCSCIAIHRVTQHYYFMHHTHTHKHTATTTELVTIPDNRQAELLAEFERRRKVRALQ